MIRVLVHEDWVIAIAGHILVVVYFFAHPYITSSHRREKPVTITLEAI